MKKLILFCAILTLSLTACNKDVSVTPTEESISAEAIFTEAAMTAAARVPTVTAIPTETSTVMPTATLVATITPINTVTPQNTATAKSSSSTAFGCYDAAFVNDVSIPDGTLLQPGETFTKTWELRNSGGCAWESNFVFIFSSGDQMSGADTIIGTAVASGATGTFSVSLIAPSTPGPYTGYWRLTNVEGTIFGEAVYVTIVVDGVIPTPTPTP